MHNVEYDAALIDDESPISAAVTPRGLSSRERQLIIVGGRAAKCAMQAQVVATIGRHEIFSSGSSRVNLKLPTSFQIVGSVRS